MELKRFLKNRITLIALLALFSVKVGAQDMIQITWKSPWSMPYTGIVFIKATEWEEFSVDWGDGVIETHSGLIDTLNLLYHAYDTTGETTVTIAASSPNCRFTYLDCSRSGFEEPQISRLILTACSDLRYLFCSANQLSDLDLSDCPNLEWLNCRSNQLTLNLSSPTLQRLECGSNQLTNLDLSGLPALTNLNCSQNQLSSLDISHCPALTNLICNNNLLTNLDVSGSDLVALECSYNQLLTLNVSDCSNLAAIYCNNNQIAHLDISACVALSRFYSDSNRFSLSELFPVSEKITNRNEKLLGTQNLLPQTAFVDEELFADQSVYKGRITEYAVTKNDTVALSDDYTVMDGKLTFNTAGNYVVTMTNSAVSSHEIRPAKVILEIDVSHSNIGILENALQKSAIYPSPTRDKVYIKTANGTVPEVKLYSTDGRLLQHVRSTEIDLSGYATGVYFLQIDQETVKIIKNF